MKKLILAAAAAAAVAVTATPAAAQNFGQRGHAQASRQVDRNVQVNRNARPNRNVVVNHNVRVNRNVVVHRNVQANQQRRWNRGERFDRRYATNYQVIRQHNRLYAAPAGHQWVRSGNDAVLVALGSGIIGALIANLF